MAASDADCFFVVSSVNFMIPHVVDVGEEGFTGYCDSWPAFWNEREELIGLFDALGKPVFLLTGDLHNSFVIKVTDRVWEFASAPHSSGNAEMKSEGRRPPNGEFDSYGRKCSIRWSTWFDNAYARRNRPAKVYCIAKVNNVFPNPTEANKRRGRPSPARRSSSSITTGSPAGSSTRSRSWSSDPGERSRGVIAAPDPREVHREGRVARHGEARGESRRSRPTRDRRRMEGDAEEGVDRAGVGGADEVRLAEERQVVVQGDVELGAEDEGQVDRRLIAEGDVGLAVLLGQSGPEGRLGQVREGVPPEDRALRDRVERHRHLVEEPAVASARERDPEAHLVVRADLEAEPAAPLAEVEAIEVILGEEVVPDRPVQAEGSSAGRGPSVVKTWNRSVLSPSRSKTCTALCDWPRAVPTCAPSPSSLRSGKP